jgi:beta-xylosidase
MNKTGNPIIRNKFTADPTVLVEGGTLYLYACHDEATENANGYTIKEWLCFSSHDLMEWTEHPVSFNPSRFKWAGEKAYATSVLKHNSLFLWYVALSDPEHPSRAIGVAVSNLPTGPFNDARGSALINHMNGTVDGSFNMDPSVLVDDDGRGYIFWGQKICYYSKLKDNLIELEGEIKMVNLPNFYEGCHIHKKKGLYYLSYGYGYPERVGYAISKSINGPWEFKGILNDYASNCETNRPAIVEFKGGSFFFYHNGSLDGGGSYRRSICVDRLYYNSDGTIRKIKMTAAGIANL